MGLAVARDHDISPTPNPDGGQEGPQLKVEGMSLSPLRKRRSENFNLGEGDTRALLEKGEAHDLITGKETLGCGIEAVGLGGDC
jgi:hypothetical protein